MNAKSRYLMILTALLAAAIAACDRAPSSRAAEAAADATAGPVPVMGQIDQADASTAPRIAQIPVKQSLATVTEVLESDPSLVALSLEEANWLRDNGYPTRSELAALSSYDVNELLEKSREHRDAKATTLLGLRRLQDGDARGAYSSLDFAARLGSLYAQEQLAFAGLQLQTGYTPGSDVRIPAADQVLFVARMETARILGDHRVDRYINQVARDLDRSIYADHILKQTTEFMRQIGEDAAIKGVRAPGPNPRPNQELWEQIEQRPGMGSIPVFRVGGGG